MRIARVFPRQTNASPDDDLAFFDGPPKDRLFPPRVDEVHVSVAFTFDMKRAEELAEEWKQIAPVRIGGPACGDPGGEFVAGRYLKKGLTITSRGCPNRCWFCDVWKRSTVFKELAIQPGTNILDDNLLACSEKHIRDVFAMLKQQKGRIKFTGGLEAKLLKPWIIDLLLSVNSYEMFFAYDTPDDLEPLKAAGKMLQKAGFGWRTMWCYCLYGFREDTVESARKRFDQILTAGFIPYPMLWRNKGGERSKEFIEARRGYAPLSLIHNRVRIELTQGQKP